jgi:hypothetical protein
MDLDTYLNQEIEGVRLGDAVDELLEYIDHSITREEMYLVSMTRQQILDLFPDQRAAADEAIDYLVDRGYLQWQEQRWEHRVLGCGTRWYHRLLGRPTRRKLVLWPSWYGLLD